MNAQTSYQEILTEITLGLKEVGRRLSVFLNKRHRELEAARKRNYIELYIPHLALGLRQILDLKEKDESKIVSTLRRCSRRRI